MNVYIRIFHLASDGGGQETHLDGVTDSAALCGQDYGGDTTIHRKDPQIIRDGRKHRVTCRHCLQMIETVKEHLSP